MSINTGVAYRVHRGKFEQFVSDVHTKTWPFACRGVTYAFARLLQAKYPAYTRASTEEHADAYADFRKLTAESLASDRHDEAGFDFRVAAYGVLHGAYWYFRFRHHSEYTADAWSWLPKYDCAREYHYQNNADKPDNISKREWAERAEVWDAIAKHPYQGVDIVVMDGQWGGSLWRWADACMFTERGRNCVAAMVKAITEVKRTPEYKLRRRIGEWHRLDWWRRTASFNFPASVCATEIATSDRLARFMSKLDAGIAAMKSKHIQPLAAGALRRKAYAQWGAFRPVRTEKLKRV